MPCVALLDPVSYTHLDVYKRQVVDLIATVGTVAAPVLTLNICESVMRFALDKDANKDKITQIGTVSYTHLDVYKRQGYGS